MLIPQQSRTTHLKNRSDWRNWALCKQYATNLWFPEKPQGRDYFAEARAICKQCPVSDECLEFALKFSSDQDKFGMFGGLNPKERMALRDKKIEFKAPEIKKKPIVETHTTKQFVKRNVDEVQLFKNPKAHTAALLIDYKIDPYAFATRKTVTSMQKKDIPKPIKLLINTTKPLEASTLTAQANAAMIMAGWEDPLDARTCALMYMGASYVMDLAAKGAVSGAITAQENAAIAGTAELAMRVWKHHFDAAKEDL
jgi:WhiB family redox-sensing transcriptional regulator